MVEAGINVGISLKNINDEIKAIAKHPSLQKLNLSINVDKSFVKSMNEFVAATKVLSTALEQQQKVINESVKTTKMLDGSIEKVTQRQLANGSIITQTTKKINEETKALNDQKKTLNDLSKELNGYTLASSRATKNKLGEVTGSKNTYANDSNQKVTVNLDNAGNVKNYSELNNYLKQKEDTLKKSEALDKAHYQALQEDQARRIALINKNLKEEEQRNQQFLNQLKTRFAEEQKIARDRDALDKAHSAAITENLNRQKAVADMQAKITAAQTKFKGNSSAVAELNALNAQLGNVSKVSNYKNALTELQTKLTQITSQAKLAGNETRTLGQRFGDAASKVAVWAGATSSVYMVTRALRDMVSVVIEVDSQVTQLKRVMDESTDFEGMMSRSIQLANELGRSITEVNENVIGFARMGFHEDDTMYLAKTSTLLQNISELTPQESVDTLTAAMTIFNVEAGKSIEIANKLNEIDNNFAVTTQNLALSMTRAGASANTFGVSMEELLGHTTAIATATRESGSIIGNSLKSIYSRITTMDKSEGVLKEAGVSMRDLSGETRDVSDIMAELAGKWNGLSKETQQNTAVNLAGRNQLTRFLALMQNFPIAIEATEAAMNSQGSATRENEKYMQSLEARIQKMKTAWETMSLAFGDAIISDSIVTLTSLIASMLNGVAKVVDVVGALPVIFGAASVALLGLHLGFRMLIVEMTKTIASMFGLTIQTGTASAGLNRFSLSNIASKISLMGLSGAANIAKVALRGLLIASGVGAVFFGLGLAIEGIVGLFSDATKATEDFTDKAEALNEKQYDLANLKQLQSEYDTLSKKTALNFDEKAKLAQIESELSSKYGITVQGIDGQTNSIQTNNEAIQAAIELKQAEIKIERDRAELDYAANALDIEKNISKYKEQLAVREESKRIAQEEYDLRAKILSETSTSDRSYDANTRHYQNAAKALQVEEEAYSESLVKLEQYTNKKGLALKAAGQNYVDEQERNNVKINGLTRQMIDIYSDASAKSKIPLTELKNDISKVFDAAQSGNISTTEQGVKILEKLPGIGTLASNAINSLSGAISQLNYQPVVEGVDSAEDSLSSFNSTIDETIARTDEMSQKISKTVSFVSESKKSIDLLNTASSEMTKKNRLSTDTIKKMNDKYHDFIKVTGLSGEAIKRYIKLKENEEKSSVNAEIRKTQTTINETKNRIEAYKKEMQAWEVMQKARVAELESQLNSGQISEQVAEQLYAAQRRSQQDGAFGNYLKEQEALKGLLAELSLLKSAKGDLIDADNDAKKATDDATKSNDKSNESYSETNEVLTDLQKNLKNVESAINSLHNKQKSLEQGSAAYRKSIMKENSLLEQKAKLLEEGIADPSKLVSYKVTTTSNTSGDSYSGEYDDIINKYASENGVDPRLVAAIIQTESTFNPNAKSGAGAMGLMQLMPKTAKGLGVKNAYDPEQNIAGGTKHIADLLKKYNGNVEYALAAYNAGSGNVNAWIKNGQMGYIPFKETREYAPKVLANYNSISGTSSSPTSSSDSGSKLDTMLSNALGLQGDFKYKKVSGKFKGTYEEFVKGATSDCSQFVQEMFDEFLNINLPRTAAEQSKQGTAVDKKDLKKGDLVFFETVKGEQASHVGIYTGNGKFIQMGDHGLKEQDINNNYWAPKYRSARRINGVGESTTSSDGKINTKTSTKAASESDKAQAKENAKKDLEEIRTEQRENQFKLIDDWVIQYSNAIEKVQNKIDKSSNKQSMFYVNSEEWRKEEQSQISLIEQQRKLREKEIKKINELMKQKKITSQDYNKQIAEIETQLLADEAETYSKRESVIDSFIGSYNDKLDEQDNMLAISEANLKSLTEGSVSYNKELQNQIPILEEKNRIIGKEIEYVKHLITSGKLSAKDTVKYTNLLKELNLSLLDTNSALSDVNKTLKDMRESAADNIIEEYKKVLEQQRDLAMDALDQEIKKEDERHEERTKNIDDEQKQFEDYINARLKALDREYASDDHEEELAKKTKDRNKILSDINELALDDSIEADVKRKALKEQLASVEEEIAKFQRDRERELVKQGLQDQLDIRKENNDKVKDEEDKKHKDALDKIEKEKKETERKYKDILEDQKYFYDLKKGLMSEDAIVVTATLGIIGGEYDKLFANMKTHIFETSKEMQNLVYQFQQGQDALNKFKVGDYSVTDPGSSDNGNSSDSTGTIKGTMASRKAWTEYLSNKQQAESIKEQMKKAEKGSMEYKGFEQQFNTLKSTNDQLRSVYGFPDGSYKDLVSMKIFSAETGGMTPAGIGNEGKFLLAHEKELILNKSDTSNMLKVVDIVRGITDKIKSNFNFNAIKPTLTPSMANSTPASYGDIKVYIDRLNADEAGAKDFFTRIVSKRRKEGF